MFGACDALPATPQRDFETALTWNEAQPQTTPNFSAVAYFFGRDLRKHLNVPVGLIFGGNGSMSVQPLTPAPVLEAMEKQDPSLLGLWKEEYERWKHCYQRFRDHEEQAFFTGGQDNEPKHLDEHLLRFHRRVIIALLASGERCETHLSQLPLDDDEHLQDRITCDRYIRALLDSLRESLWHPVKNAERVTELRKLASK